MNQPDSKWQPDDGTPVVKISLDEALGATTWTPDDAAAYARGYGDAHFTAITDDVAVAVDSNDPGNALLRVGNSVTIIDHRDVNRLRSVLNFLGHHVLKPPPPLKSPR